MVLAVLILVAPLALAELFSVAKGYHKYLHDIHLHDLTTRIFTHLSNESTETGPVPGCLHLTLRTYSRTYYFDQCTMA